MSTNKAEQLRRLLDEQETLLRDLRSQAESLDESAVLAENREMTRALADARQEVSNLQAENGALRQELEQTKAALFARLADEKLRAFTGTQKRLEDLYYRTNGELTNRLQEYEKNCVTALQATRQAVEAAQDAQFNDLSMHLQDLQAELERRRQWLQQEQAMQLGATVAYGRARGETLRTEPLTDSEIRTGKKHKNLETFVGLNILSKAGILLFLVGIVLLGRYAFLHLPDVFKSCLIFLLGGVLIGVGELFFKKEKNVFSQTLISGGVAVLYAAAATGRFAFSLYGNNVTFLLFVAITAGAMLLSGQLKSQVVCAFGAVGGYLPVVAAYLISFGGAAAEKSYLPVSAVYFCLLACVVFLMTYNKKWYAPQFLGYGLHLISIGGILACANAVSRLPGYGYALPLAAAYAIVSFLLYLLMPAAKILRRQTVGTADTVLLGLNAVSGAISVGVSVTAWFPHGGDKQTVMVGLVFLLFTVLYAALSGVAVKDRKPVTASTVVTSLAALCFSLLVVPLLFGHEYAPIAWSAEGATIAVFGIRRAKRAQELAGFICLILAAGVALYDFTHTFYDAPSPLMLGTVLAGFWAAVVCGLTVGRKGQSAPVRYVVLEPLLSVGTVAYCGVLLNRLRDLPFVTVTSDFTHLAGIVAAALAMALLLRTGPLKNWVSLYVSDIVACVLVPVFTLLPIIDSFCFNVLFDVFANRVENRALWSLNLVLLIVLSVAILLFFARAAAHLAQGLKLPGWANTFLLSGAVLQLLTLTFMTHFSLHFYSVLLSAVYLAAACVLLAVGFRKSYKVVRSGGLVLILFAFAKLCFVDTFRLDSGWKIAAYFAFGALLIVISFVYQRFVKQLDVRANGNGEPQPAAVQNPEPPPFNRNQTQKNNEG